MGGDANCPSGFTTSLIQQVSGVLAPWEAGTLTGLAPILGADLDALGDELRGHWRGGPLVSAAPEGGPMHITLGERLGGLGCDLRGFSGREPGQGWGGLSL